MNELLLTRTFLQFFPKKKQQINKLHEQQQCGPCASRNYNNSAFAVYMRFVSVCVCVICVSRLILL